MPFPALMVLDGERRSALGIVRSLGQKGIPVIVGSNNSPGKSALSRYIQLGFTYITEDDELEKAHSVIIKQIRLLRPEVLMPVFDTGWSVVYKFYDDYSSLTNIVPNPGRELFEKLQDKHCLTDLAEKYAIPIPKTYRFKTIAEALSISKSLPYPVLLKPRKGSGGISIKRAVNARQLADILKHTKEVPLIQEEIYGEDLELTILSVHGEPLAISAYMSLRNAPLPYGPPVACRTIWDENLIRIGTDFLKKIGYHGVAHLDFRRDRRDGEPKMLDFNARIAGTNDISLRSGLDFGFLLYKLAIGESPKPSFAFGSGLEFRWLMPGELMHLKQTPYKIQTLQNLSKWNNVHTDISLTDPLPNVAMVFDIFKRLVKKLKP